METYDLELKKALKQIKESKAKLVCIQLPDGLKPKALEIADYLEKNSKAKILIWGESCYGACDTPLALEKLKIDLLIQFGHTKL